MLEIKDITFRYSRRAPLILDNINLTLEKGEIGILLGKNGSGKTTLFKNILGIEKPESGSISYDGKDLLRLSRRERAGYIAYVPQDIQFGDLTVYDTVLMGRMAYFGLRAGKEDEKITEEVLNDMGLTELASRNANELSGGERQKIAIARALVQEPKLLIFDEPTGNLDIANEQLILKEAKKVAKEKGIGILTSLHDLNQALDLGTKFFFIKEGKIVYSGGPEIVTKEVIKEIFNADVEIIEHDGRSIIIA
jgi:iron complex transport system ATP-binding protein